MKKGDKIAVIILALLIIISFVGVYTYLLKSKNNHPVAVIKQDGKEIQRIDLKEIKESKEWKIYDDKGNYNTIRVEPDRISIIDADCPDKLCVKFGWLSRSGQTAVCMPNKLTIEIQGGTSEVDVIS